MLNVSLRLAQRVACATREGLYKIDALEVEQLIQERVICLSVLFCRSVQGECTTARFKERPWQADWRKFNGAQPSLVTPQLVESELQRLPLPRKIA